MDWSKNGLLADQLTDDEKERFQAFHDHEMAVRLASVNPDDEEALATAIHEATQAVTDHISASGIHDRRSSTFNQFQVKCTACMEVSPACDILQAPCFHYYCRACSTRLVEDSLKNETLFPPRCCRQAIPFEIMRQFLGLALVRRCEEKVIEKSDNDKTYCSNPSCSKYFLPTQHRTRQETCSSCGQVTCHICKQQAHNGQCVRDAKDMELRILANGEGWKECPGCHNLVELHNGCNHMTCRCGYEFCYVCTRKWRSCDCPGWDEERLYDRTNFPRRGQQHPAISRRGAQLIAMRQEEQILAAREEAQRVATRERARLVAMREEAERIARVTRPVQTCSQCINERWEQRHEGI